MVTVITVDDIKQMIHEVGLRAFFLELIEKMKQDHVRWQAFHKMPRVATHYPQGVIELMPISDDEFYAYKYVNGHPNNPRQGKLTVAAMGVLADVKTGYPLMISEMTILTAMRTAAASALGSHYLARANPKTLALIGTGSQGEFQALAQHFALGIEEIKYYDIDTKAMQKFSKNLSRFELTLTPCQQAQQTLEGADIIITATAHQSHARVLENDWVVPGMHINGLGGDCPGKTELDPKILSRCKIVVEYLEQAKIEGEIQHINPKQVYAELWQIIEGGLPGRVNDDEITLFDSVGFAIQDYSVLRYVYSLAQQLSIGQPTNLIVDTPDPKNLFSFL